jgi:hypothetical protein
MSYRKKPTRWFTNRKGQHIPLFSSGKRRSRHYLPKIGGDVIRIRRPPVNSQLPKPKKAMIDFALNTVLSKLPFISELHTAYVVADSIYDNWELIKQLYDSVQDGRVDGLATSIENQVLQDSLSSIQTNIIWSKIGNAIPSPFRKESKAFLSQIMDKVTMAEIDFISNFLSAEKTRRLKTTKPNKTSRNFLIKNEKLPDDVKYV